MNLFEEFLDKDKLKTTHKSYLQMLVAEMHKTINHLNPEYMGEFFSKNDAPFYLHSNK